MAAIELSFTAWKPYPAPWHFLHTLAAAHKNSPFLKSNDPLKPETSPSFLPLPRHSCHFPVIPAPPSVIPATSPSFL
jgi:hypothetical protein